MSVYQKFSCFILVSFLFSTSVPNVFAKKGWAKEVVESTMTRYSPASKLGSWDYKRGFYLYSQYRVWQKLGDDRYFQYIKDWLDDHINSNGKIDRSINTLDNVQPGLITLYCYEETGEEKYKLAAENIRKVFDTYPRTSDGALWHMKHRIGELWLDGTYMSLPFLMKYGQLFGDTTYCYNEATRQIILYASHLKDSTGLLYHGYDEDGSESWADPVTHRSAEFWGRSMGWFGMAIVDILEILPGNHPNRAGLIEILSDLITGLAYYQDEETGLWYQVTNKEDQPDNWLETSCSCMYSFFTARAVERGYVDSSYIEMALKGYEGVLLTKISIGDDGLTYFRGTCEGTEVGDYEYYINRPRTTNNMRGLPAFVLADLEMSKHISDLSQNRPPFVTITEPGNDWSIPYGEDVQITVTAGDLGGTVTRVEFYEGDNLLFIDDQEPWEYNWSDAALGDYVLTAVAYDDSNASNRSSPINITINYMLYCLVEDAVISEGRLLNYGGIKIIDLYNKVGSYAEWLVSIPKAGNWNISLGFSYITSPPDINFYRIELNGTVLDSLMESNILWKNIWFESGESTIRVTSMTSEAAPYINGLILIFSNDSTSSIEERSLRPMTFALYQNFPNPFNPTTTIKYSITDPCKVKLTVYNMMAQHVTTLVDKRQSPGTYTVHFDASHVPSGIYVYKLQSDERIFTKKMLLVR